MDKLPRGYTFDDVLILPRFTEVQSRKEVDLSTNLGFGLTLKLPVLSANMETITEEKMAIAMAQAGGMGVIHRFCETKANCEMFDKVFTYLDSEEGRKYTEGQINVGVSVGTGQIEQDRAMALFKNDAYIFCLDVAHGAQQSVLDQYIWLRKTLHDIYIIVGNFGIPEEAITFLKKLDGARVSPPNALKIGIGPGSACTTRVKTGVGVPQLTAIQMFAEAFDYCSSAEDGIALIADGGMKTPGDIAKALAAGADAVMLGGMLAGANETPGLPLNHSGCKLYKGSASGSYADGWKTSEGEIAVVPAKGSVEHILKDIEGGLRSAFSYTGSYTLREFQRNAKFIEVSSATIRENGAHILR